MMRVWGFLPLLFAVLFIAISPVSGSSSDVMGTTDFQFEGSSPDFDDGSPEDENKKEMDWSDVAMEIKPIDFGGGGGGGGNDANKKKKNEQSQPQGSNGLIVIFLDIDGVLAPYVKGSEDGDTESNDPLKGSCYNDLTTPTMDAFSHLLTNLKKKYWIVLTSTWRLYPECQDKAMDYFWEYGMLNPQSPLKTIAEGSFPNDRTQDLGKDGTQRQDEIFQWIQKHNKKTTTTTIDAWIVLEDNPDLILKDKTPHQELFQKHSIVIKDCYTGLTKQDANKALQLVQQQLDNNKKKKKKKNHNNKKQKQKQMLKRKNKNKKQHPKHKPHPKHKQQQQQGDKEEGSQ